MKLRVQVFGSLRREAGGNHFSLEIEEGARVADALAALGIADRVDVWALVDGERAGRDRELTDGAEVVFFQPVGGG